MSEGSVRVLVIEDDRASARMLRLVLVTEGFVVDVVRSREDALEALGVQQPSIIVMDYMMQGLNAETFLTTIRDQGFNGKIVLCTGMDRDFDFPVDALIRKPFAPDALTQILRTLVAG